MQLLHFSSEQLSGTSGAITVTNQDGVQEVAYMGDVTDEGGPLSLADANAVGDVSGLVTNTTYQTIPGFVAFATLDPLIIADFESQGSVNSSDHDAITAEIGGAAVIWIPYAPIGLSVTGPSAPTAAPTHFVLHDLSVSTSGLTLHFTVTAEDAFNHTVTGYTGLVTFTSTDGQAILPVNATLTSGLGTFSATLMTAGAQTLIASDSVTDDIEGSSTAITVTPAAVQHFAISAPRVRTAGEPFTFTVTAEDQYNNTVTGYSGSAGTVDFSSSDTSATVPANSTLSGGIGTFSATLISLGSQTIVARDSVTTSTSGSTSVTVVAGSAIHFVVTTVSSVTAGNGFVVMVTAENSSNAVATGYSGTVHFTSSDSQSIAGVALPADSTMTSGIGYFAAYLETAGTQTITVTDTAANSISGASAAIVVSPAVASYFTVTPLLPTYPGVQSGPTSFASRGVAFTLTVITEDAFGNIAPTYTGTVHFTSSDTAAVLPANATLSSGVGTFSATLMTLGAPTLTATDTTQSSITGNSGPIITRGLVVTSFSYGANTFSVTFNQPFQLSTVALYSYTSAGLPDDVQIARSGAVVSLHGSLVFNANLTSLTFVRTDMTTATGAFSPSSGLFTAGNYTVTLRTYNGTDGLQDTLGDLLDGSNNGGSANFQITFSVPSTPVVVGLPDFARGPSNTDAIFFNTSVTNGSTFALSYTNPTTLTTGSVIVTFSSIAATLQNNIQTALNAMTQVGSTGGTPNTVVVVTNDTTSGANVLVTFQDSLVTATNEMLTSTTTGVSIGVAMINASNNVPTDGIPITISDGYGVTSGSFILDYNPSLLTISGGFTTISGATFTITTYVINSTSATATISFSCTTPSSATTPMTLGSLIATVPMSATANYGAQQLLHFSSEVLNGGAIAVTNEDAVQVVAYLGGVDRNGAFDLDDANEIAGVAESTTNTTAQTIPGFTAFPNLDPLIIGDVSIQGSVNTTDASAMTQELGGR